MEKIKIACIGDSLTWGYMTDNQETDNYPAVLQNSLGDGYIVKNFGVNGHTVSKLGDMPYWGHENLEIASQWLPDIVIIMLGTNDTKPRNWHGADHYKDQYQQLINHFSMLSKIPTIVLCTIPSTFYMDGAMTYELDKEALKAVPAAVKELGLKNNLQVIDVEKATQGRSDLFPEDGVHTSTAGAKFIADTIYQEVKA